MMTMFNTPDLRVPLEKIAYLMGAGDIEIRIADTYDLDEAAAAQTDVLGESFLGKLLITP
jgi:NADPH:quinone reductase-like Zn-dependent oxidoreductase